MKNLCFALFVALGVAATGSTANAAPDDGVVLIDHTKVDAAFAHGGPLLSGGNYKIQAGRREGPGQVEIHTNDTDIFYITEGSATLITGGTAVDPKETAPGEIRADKSTGGTTRRLSKGDVVVIPAGVPHWMPETSKPFVYFVVKVSK